MQLTLCFTSQKPIRLSAYACWPFKQAHVCICLYSPQPWPFGLLANVVSQRMSGRSKVVSQWQGETNSQKIRLFQFHCSRKNRVFFIQAGLSFNHVLLPRFRTQLLLTQYCKTVPERAFVLIKSQTYCIQGHEMFTVAKKCLIQMGIQGISSVSKTLITL